MANIAQCQFGRKRHEGVCPDRKDYCVGPDSHRGELDLEVALVAPMRMSSNRALFSDVNLTWYHSWGQVSLFNTKEER